MIGVLRTTHPIDGRGIVVRFSRFNGIVRIISIVDASDNNVFEQLSNEQLQKIMNEISQLNN